MKIKDEPKLAQSKLEVEELVVDIAQDISFKDVSLTDLNNKLADAVANEDYELAAKLRDEISKRKK